MTPKQIELIRQTWRSVASLGDTAAQIFYHRLFEIDPGTKPLFADTDMSTQSQKLLDALGFVVKSADHPEKLVPLLQELGRRHVRYGVEDRQYQTVGAALLWTLEQGLGSAFTDDVRGAWTAAYTLVADTMVQAAQDMRAEQNAMTAIPGRTAQRRPATLPAE